MKSRPHILLLTVLCVGVAAPSLLAGVVINEIHYDPDDKTLPQEFIELYNDDPADVDVSDWFFSSGVSYRFPPGTTIPGEGYLIVAQDPQTLSSTLVSPDTTSVIIGPFDGRLSNEGERVVLRSADGLVQDEVSYDPGFPWPTASSGKGSSMELIHPSLDNNLGGSWRASGFLNFEAGERIDFINAEDTQWHYRKGTSEASAPPSAWREVDFAEDGTWLVGQTSIGYGDDDDNTVLADMQGSYTSVYLRHEFLVDDAEGLPSTLKLGLYVDDGAVAWINGVEVFRSNVPGGELPFDGTGVNHEAEWQSALLPDPTSYLVPGRNILAIHALNQSPTSSDFSVDATLHVPGAGDFGDIDAFVAPPTPGARNSVYSENAPPQLRQVSHAPAQPISGVPLLVTAKATDPDGVASVTLEYQLVDPGAYIRLADPAYASDWTPVEMADSGTGGDSVPGDGTYSVILPATLQAHRRLVRYRVTVIDGTGLELRAPYLDDPQPNFAYFVYDGVPGWRGASRPGVTPIQDFDPEVMTSLPVYHLIAREEDVVNCQYNSGYRYLHLPGTLVYEDTVHDHIEFEIRGEYSTYVSGKNKWRLFFNRGHDFQARDNHGKKYKAKWRTMNFSAAATPWVPTNRGMAALGESVAFKAYGLAGVPSPNTNFFHFRIIDEAVEAHSTDQYRGDLWGLYMTIEHTDGRFLDERGLPDGNTYKIEGGNGDKRNQGPTQSKDSSDYNALKNGYNQSQSIAWWRSNVNLPVYYSFRGVNTAVNNHDLREGWNIAQYHNPETDTWSVMPWDLDMLYMPVTHWSGIMNFQNALTQHALLLTEYRNRARELQDLLFTPDQLGQLVNELAAVENPPGWDVTLVDVDEAMWNYHPRTASNHRGVFYRNPSTHSARGGTITRTLVSADHEGMGMWVQDFVLQGYGFDRLTQHAQDTAIPDRPVITSTSLPGFPVDGLTFRSSTFSDPQGGHTFGAMKWRIAEISPRGIPPYEPEKPKLFEIQSAWESEELTAFESDIAIPPEAVKIGAIYRARVCMMDDSARWSHWSLPVEFATSAPTSAFPPQQYLRITEIMYHPSEDSDLEFIELKNTGPAWLDLSAVSFTDGIEFEFASGEVEGLAPGEVVVIVKNRDVFEAWYGVGSATVAGEFADRLGNGGETIALTYGLNATILDFTYDDAWYPPTDGVGYSLVIVDPAGPESAWGSSSGWRVSDAPGGSPGLDDSEPPVGGFQLPADINQDSSLDISDGIRLLLHLFEGMTMTPPCGGQTIAEGGNGILADFDGNGQVQITDAVLVFGYLFQQGPAPTLGTTCVRIEGCPNSCGL